MVTMAWIYLAVSVWCAWFTYNALRPAHDKGPAVVPSFFAGWLTSELAAHHLVFQFTATLIFWRAGVLRSWQGVLGFAITLASWAGLTTMLLTSRGSGQLVEESLESGLGADFRERFTPEVRAALGAKDIRRSRLILPFWLTHPEVTKTRNIRYADGAGSRHLLDVYRPDRPVRDAPVLLQIHGGGWVIGDKSQQGLPLVNHMAARGWVCVAINYRLSPKSAFPAHIEDCKLAIRWIRENIAEYGGNPDFVCVTGGSAGGHLSSLTALSANDPAWQKGFVDVDTSMRACVPFYGVYDFTFENGSKHELGMLDFIERTVVKQHVDDNRPLYEAASPIYRIGPDAPPFYVVHGTNDTLVPVSQARRFVDKLRAESRQAVLYTEFPGTQHAFEVFHSPRTENVCNGVADFLSSVYSDYLRSDESPDSDPARSSLAGAGSR